MLRWRNWLWLVFAGEVVTASTAAPPIVRVSDNNARKLVQAAMAAMGGETKLRALNVVRISALRRRNALEQSIRPDGPYLETIDDLIETRRFDQFALRSEMRSRGFAADWIDSPRWIESSLLVAGGAALTSRDDKPYVAQYSAVAPAEQSLALDPERSPAIQSSEMDRYA